MMTMYRHAEARAMFNTLLDDREKRNIERCTGYFHEEGIWIAFDNRSGDFWTEEFPTKKKAKRWLKNA